jgi:small-conductance mechanosensitive channel/CRP-like cAMP-binding protein
MAPSESMIQAPAGWQTNGFWANFGLETADHAEALAAASVCLVLLVIGRALLPVADRQRLRWSFFMIVMFAILLPARIAFLTLGLDSIYFACKLAALVALAWCIIGVAGLLTFDLLGKRFGVPKILRDLTTTIASIVTLVMLLSRSGVNLLSLITTSAVLTAVIGLALQDTLGNLLSGVGLQLESPFAIGDWIRVDERPIGKVLEIRWRSTIIQTKNGDLVVIPNGAITKGQITNFNKDGLENRRWVYFNVHIRHAPNLVQKAIVEAIQGTPNVSETTKHDCLVWAFRESSIEYAVRYRLVDYLPDDPTDSEVRKRIWYAMHRRGFEIPYPARNVFMTELTAAREQGKSEKEMARRRNAIERVSFFKPLEAAEREHLAEGLRSAIYGNNELIIRAGEPGDSMFIIHSGEVGVRIGLEGLEKEVATLQTGQFFGEMSLMTGEPRRATVAARGDVECFAVDREHFQTVLQQKPSLVAEIGKLFAAREQDLRQEREGLAVAARAHEENEALLGRIMSFFGLS